MVGVVKDNTDQEIAGFLRNL